MRALISVSDKTRLSELARGLVARGVEIVSTGGTAAALRAEGLSVTSVTDLTGSPEMMDGRIKTLHPRIHGGILARRTNPADLEAAAAHGIGLIDLVVVNLYPFVRRAADPAVSFDHLIEQIDIGGPSLIRAAAKNFADVLVVVSPDDYEHVLAEIDRGEPRDLTFRFTLARKAFAHTAAYDTTIASTLAEFHAGGAGFTREGRRSDRLALDLTKVRDLRYGENPHQPAAWYAAARAGGFAEAAIVQGRELSFTNLLDLDAAARIVAEFEEPAAVIVKHTNPCGAAIGDSPADAYLRARDADPVSAFGGIVGLNRAIDAETATALTATFLEAVVAPGVDTAAAPILARKGNLRVVVVSNTGLRDAEPYEVRSILGGVLVQARDTVVEASSAWPASGSDVRVVTRRTPTESEWRALRFAWRIAAHVKSNAVVFSDDRRTLAIGAGQMSRVDAVRLAVTKADAWAAGSARALAGSVAASDAFFPFRDGLDAIAAAGATAVVQPGGSVRDDEVIAAADGHGLAMVFTGRRHFRH
jgi:phosphoribosylaminoimidazolecarboxamide formyltransferase/IMP cyclohydrolase